MRVVVDTNVLVSAALKDKEPEADTLDSDSIRL